MMINLFELENINMVEFSRLFTPNAKRVIEVLRKYGFDVRVIGGAVRDFLRGASPRDVDFATDAEPGEIMFIFDLEGITHDDGGIQHGTIKAVFGDEIVDVTSISYRLRLQNGRVMIDRTKSWEHDSLRRDLTINSMSLDVDGRLYDYTGGLDDLRNQLVRFNHDAEDMILQDPFTLLRWFKAIDYFDDPKWLRKDRQLVTRHAKLVPSVLDQKRAKKLLQTLKSSKNWKRSHRLLCQTGVAHHIGITCSVR